MISGTIIFQTLSCKGGRMFDLNIHIGAPKSLSTSIQSALHSAPNIDYLGFIPGPDPSKWFSDSVIQRFLDCDIKYASRLTFMQNKKINVTYFDNFIANNAHFDKWVSCENLSARFTLEEPDCFEKLYRVLSTVNYHKVALHMIFRKYSSAVYSMYKELVSRKFNKNYEDFLNELYFLNDMGIADHIMPKRIFDTFALLKNEFPSIQLFCYFPITKDEQFYDLNMLSKLWKIELQNYNKNQSLFDVEALCKFNYSGYPENTLSNLMELHRYGLATTTGNLVDFWRDRRTRRTILTQLQKVSQSYVNTTDKFEASSLAKLLRDNHPSTSVPDGIRILGEVDNLW